MATKTYFYNENCFDTMKKMESKNFKVNIVLTSPPYNTARCGKTERSINNYENRFVFVICRKDEFKTFQANKQVKSVSKTGQKFYENIFNFIEAPNNDGSCKLNKATYSSELVLKLLEIYASENDKIYDPFMGTGTTAIGCMKFYGGEDKNNLVCIGSEISEAQVQFAKDRITNFRNQVNS